MFRVGIVKAQDTTNCRVRVTFPDRQQMTSWWLPICVPKSQNDKAYWMPDIGEAVVCLMDQDDEDGAVLGSIYSSADTTPVQSADQWQVKMKDGAVFSYNRATHAFAINLPAGATATISANGAQFSIDSSGDIAVISASGNITIQGGAEVTINAAALIKLAGGGPAIARVGDSTTCPAGTGSITSGSSKVQSG